MRLHYLVLAHHRPERLGDLLAALDMPGARVVVHIDRKSPATPFRNAAAGRANVEFVDDRHRVEVRWADGPR